MGFLDELDEIDAQKQKTMPVPIAPQGEPSFLEQLDQIDKERTAALTVNNRSWLQQAEDAVSGVFEPVKDIYHGALTLPATVAGQALDMARLATGDKFDILKNASNGLENLTNKFEENTLSPEALRQKENLAKFFADGHYTDLPRVLAENPRGVTNDLVKTFGSMFIPGVAGAKAASLAKALKFANPNKVIAPTVTATNAAMNAADTFTATDDLNLEDRYKGAGVAGGVSLLANALTGGAADKTLAKLIAGDVSKQVNKSILGAAIKGGAKDAGKEGFQEFLEEGGNAVGENVARKEDFDLNNILKRAGYGAALGGISGGPIGSLNGAAGASRENLVNKLQNTQKQFEQTAATNTADNSGEPVANLIKNLGQHTNLKQVQPEPKENANSALSALEVTESALKNAPSAPDNAQNALKNALGAPNTVENSAPTAPELKQAEPPTAAPVDVMQDQTQQEQAAQIQEKSPILQNRDRSSNSSVMQMKSMANNLDYGRTGYSRDLANGAPVVSYGSVPAVQLGRKDFAVDSKGSRIPVQYAVLEADDILTSNDINGMSNHEYGNPQRVNAIAGNGRITAMQYAYAHNTAGNYRQEFEADDLHGISPQIIKSMKHPVLVRVMPTENITEDIGDRSNTTSNLQLNPVEVAKNDVNRVDLSNLKFNADDSPSNESILQFLSSLPQQEVAQLVQSDGTPNSEAIRRFNNALFQKAYKSERLTNLFATAVRVEGKRIINILARLAPKAIELEGAGDLDIRPLIVEAVHALMVGIQKGQKLEDLARQTDAFEDPDVMEFKKLFAIDQRGVEKPLRILEEAVDFAINAAKEAQNDNMFGMEPPTRRDVLNYYNGILDDEYGNKAARYKTTDENAAGSSSITQNAPGRDGGGDQGENDARGSADNQGDGKPQEGADESIMFARAAKNDRLHDERGDVLYSKRKPTKEEWAAQKKAEKEKEIKEEAERIGRSKHVSAEVKADISELIGKESLEVLEKSGRVKFVYDLEELPKDIRKTIKASSSEITSDKEDMTLVRKEVLAKVKQELEENGNQVTITSDKTNVTITSKGVKHSLHYRKQDWRDALALLHVKELVQESEFVDRAPNVHGVTDPYAVSHYKAKIEIDERLYPVRIVVRHHLDKSNNFYHISVDRENPEATRELWPQKEGLTTPYPSSGDGDSLSPRDLEIKYSKDGVVQGIYNLKTGEAYILTGNIKKGEARGIFLHEVGIHMAADREFREVMQPILKRGLQLVKVGNANGDKTAQEAYKRLTDAGEDPNNANEATAYLVQVAANKSDLSAPIKRFMNQLRAALVAWMVRHGMMNADSLTTQDLVDIAVSNVRAMAKKEIQGAKEAQVMSLEAKLEFSKSGGPGGSHSRNTSWGFGPLVSDEFGHIKFGWGESLYDGGAKILKRTFDLIDAKAGNRFQLGMMSKDLRKLMRQFKADKEYIMHELEPIVRELSTWSAEEREMVSDIIEKCLKTNVIPPERVVRVAAAMQDIFNKQTDELLRLGGISKESAERWRGQYLPRIYNRSSKEFQRTIFDEFFGKNRPISSLTANHLKGRGIFETATTRTELEQYLAAGWELRDPNWSFEDGKLEYVGSDPRSNTLFGNDKDALISEGLTVWRDFTYDERILMGEVRDSLSRFVLGYMSTQRDLAVMRLYNQLAQDSRYSRSTPADGYVAVPNIDIPGVQGVKKYANLSGRYVTQEAFSQLQNVSKVQNDFTRAYKKMLSAWKEGKTVLNPVAHFNNTVGNITMCHFAGVSYWEVNKYVEAAREFAKGEKKSTLIQEAFKYGLFSGSFTKEEMAALVPDKQLQELLNRSESGLDKAIDLVNGVLSWGLRSKLRSAYEFEDSFFKLVLYKKAREEALMSPEDAVDYATSYIFTYDDLPTGAAAIRDYAVPFFAWTYKAIPCLLKTALVYPHRFLAPAAVLYGLNMATYFLLAGGGGDDDDLLKRWERAQKLQDYESETMPDFMKGLTAFLTPKSVRIWNDSLTGQAQFLDISRWIPGGDMFDADNQMGGVSIFQPLMPSHPLVGIGLAMIANKDNFTGKEVVNPLGDSTAEKIRKRGAWLAKNLSPSLAPWSYHGTRLAQAISYETGYGFLRNAPFAKETHEQLTSLFGANGYTGNHVPMELSRALQHSVGVKNRLVDFEYQESMAGLSAKREINAIKQQFRAKARAAQRQGLPMNDLEGERKDAFERIQRIMEKEKERRENLAKAKQAAK